MIAYLRDFALRYGFIAESFETSVAWSGVKKLCAEVKARVEQECRKHKVVREPFISFRVTQIYDTGAAVYIYFGFLYRGLADPVAVYS